MDKNGEIIQDDELIVNDGDIILCQATGMIYPELPKNIHEAFKHASKKASNNEISTIMYDSKINIKILKIRKE